MGLSRRKERGSALGHLDPRISVGPAWSTFGSSLRKKIGRMEMIFVGANLRAFHDMAHTLTFRSHLVLQAETLDYL